VARITFICQGHVKAASKKTVAKKTLKIFKKTKLFFSTKKGNKRIHKENQVVQEKEKDDNDDELGEGFTPMTGRRGKSVRSIIKMRQKSETLDYHRPNSNIFLKDGRSLLDCQKQAMSSQQNWFVEEEEMDDCGYRNDNICVVCSYGVN